MRKVEQIVVSDDVTKYLQVIPISGTIVGNMPKQKHQIVIVGGGFAGVKVALELARDKRFHITLINDEPDFAYYGTLYKTAMGGSSEISSIPLQEIFTEYPNVNLTYSKAKELDRKSQTVTTKDGQKFTYSALILGLGVVTNYFNIPGIDKYAFGIKSLNDAEALKDHLHRQLLEEKNPVLNYIVVGGGPTGVELAGVLGDYVESVRRRHGLPERKVHVDLVEAAPRLVPRMPKDISRAIARQLRRQGVKLYLKTAVESQTSDELVIGSKPIRSHTVIWTAGMSNNPFFTEQGFQASPNRKVRVDQFLQAEPGIYVVGDNADTPYSGMAQTALHDGVFVAQNLIRLADGKDNKPYHAKKPIYVMPAGPNWAAVLWGPVRIYGRLGWILRRAADLIAYHDYEPWFRATKHWLAEYETEESCPRCFANTQTKS